MRPSPQPTEGQKRAEWVSVPLRPSLSAADADLRPLSRTAALASRPSPRPTRPAPPPRPPAPARARRARPSRPPRTRPARPPSPRPTRPPHLTPTRRRPSLGAGAPPATPRGSARRAGGAAVGRSRRPDAMPARRPHPCSRAPPRPSVALSVAAVDEAPSAQSGRPRTGATASACRLGARDADRTAAAAARGHTVGRGRDCGGRLCVSFAVVARPP